MCASDPVPVTVAKCIRMTIGAIASPITMIARKTGQPTVRPTVAGPRPRTERTKPPTNRSGDRRYKQTGTRPPETARPCQITSSITSKIARQVQAEDANRRALGELDDHPRQHQQRTSPGDAERRDHEPLVGALPEHP